MLASKCFFLLPQKSRVVNERTLLPPYVMLSERHIMSHIKKRKADGTSNKDERMPTKRIKHTTSTHIKPTVPEPTKESSPQILEGPSPATESPSQANIEANDSVPKSFQDLGIIPSLCDACTALGYKVHIPSYSWSRLLLKFADPDSDTNGSNTFGFARKGPNWACRDWQWEDGCVCTPNSPG